MVRRLLALATVALLLAACDINGAEPGTPTQAPDPDRPAVEETATPTVEPASPASPAATATREPEWSLSVNPSSGSCEAIETFRGERFPPGEPVVLVRWVSLSDIEQVAEAVTNASGSFEAGVPPDALDGCTPGLEIVFEARLEARVGDHGGGWPRAVYSVPTEHPLLIEPAEGGCEDTIAVSGQGYEPGSRVDIFFGGADPFAHSFASVATVEADGTGEIAVDVQLPLGPNCVEGEIGLYASAEGEPRRKAVYTVEAGE